MPRDPAVVFADRKLLGERLYALRRKAGFRGQRAAAAALGRPQSFVADIDSAQRRVDVVELLELAEVYGFDPCEVVGPPRGWSEQVVHDGWQQQYRARLAGHAAPPDGGAAPRPPRRPSARPPRTRRTPPRGDADRS